MRGKKQNVDTRDFYESLLHGEVTTQWQYRNARKFFNHHRETDKANQIMVIMRKMFPCKRRGGDKVKLVGSCNDCKYLTPDNRKYRITPHICSNSKSFKHEFYVDRFKDSCKHRESNK
jgi:hypothetical protein